MDSDSEQEEDFAGWEEDEDENTEVKSLFSDTILPSVGALLEHDRKNFNFDLAKCCAAVGAEDLSLIMLVNYIRSEVQSQTLAAASIPNDSNGNGITPAFLSALELRICENPQVFLSDERYMRPVQLLLPGSGVASQESDPLLYLLAEALHIDLGEGEGEAQGQGRAGRQPPPVAGEKSGGGGGGGASAPISDAAQAEAQIQALRADVLRLQKLVGELTSDADHRHSSTHAGGGPGAGAAADASADASKAPVPNDGYYFDSYGQLGIHEVMLTDKPRTSTYGAALLANAEFLKGKTVLDVGCGTGILSLFAAKAGAKRVVGIDMSTIIERSKKVIDRNGYSDVITLVQGRLETTELPLEPGSVDVIISEWMGYGLYFENMLTSVLHARDRYLNKTSGVLMPSQASIFVDCMTAEGEEDRVGYWSDVYGFNMDVMSEMLLPEAQVQYVRAQDLIGTRCLAHVLDIGSAVDADLDFNSPFCVTITRDNTELKAFVLSFDVLFARGSLRKQAARSEGSGEGEDESSSTAGFNEQVLSTGAAAPCTHWKQTVLWLPPSQRAAVSRDVQIRGVITYARSAKNQRDYDIILQYSHPSDGKERVLKYVLGS